MLLQCPTPWDCGKQFYGHILISFPSEMISYRGRRGINVYIPVLSWGAVRTIASINGIRSPVGDLQLMSEGTMTAADDMMSS